MPSIRCAPSDPFVHLKFINRSPWRQVLGVIALSLLVSGIVGIRSWTQRTTASNRSPNRSAQRSPSTSVRRTTPSQHFSVATFNVGNLFDAWDDPYTEDELTQAKSSRALKRLAATFRRMDADVVALQEVESLGVLEQFRQKQIPDLGYRHAVLCEGNDRRGIDVAVLSRLAVGRVTSHRHMAFRDASGKWVRFRRDLLIVEIRPPRGAVCEFWVVHLKSNYDGREAAEVQRMAEAKQIRRLYEAKMKQDPAAAIILCGDFNDELQRPVLRWLLGSRRHALQSLTADLRTSSAFTYNIHPYESMVDFLFVSPAMAKRYRRGTYRIVDGSARWIGSDHNPVRAEFYLLEKDARTAVP